MCVIKYHACQKIGQNATGNSNIENCIWRIFGSNDRWQIKMENHI